MPLTLFISPIHSAILAFEANGNQNGWSQPSTTSQSDVAGLVNSFITDPNFKLPPGIVQIPVCNNSVAHDNFFGLVELGISTPANYPCNFTVFSEFEATDPSVPFVPSRNSVPR
jgi:hypothetical protein